jgi:hypothetical protein
MAALRSPLRGRPGGARVGLAAGGEEGEAPPTQHRPRNHRCPPQPADVKDGASAAAEEKKLEAVSNKKVVHK